MVFFILFLSPLFLLISGKVYDRCELARELKYVHRSPPHQLATWVCIARYESEYKTHVVGSMGEKGTKDHGIFQINDKYWCSPPGKGQACHLTCAELEDDDITDDFKCAQMIYKEHKRLSGDGFNAWAVYEPHCKNGRVDEFLYDCFGENEVKKSGANSTALQMPYKSFAADDKTGQGGFPSEFARKIAGKDAPNTPGPSFSLATYRSFIPAANRFDIFRSTTTRPSFSSPPTTTSAYFSTHKSTTGFQYSSSSTMRPFPTKFTTPYFGTTTTTTTTKQSVPTSSTPGYRFFSSSPTKPTPTKSTNQIRSQTKNAFAFLSQKPTATTRTVFPAISQTNKATSTFSLHSSSTSLNGATQRPLFLINGVPWV